jgi:hypothetical protein
VQDTVADVCKIKVSCTLCLFQKVPDNSQKLCSHL